MTDITDFNLDSNLDNNAHLVFIDTSLDNYQSLITENNSTNVVLLDPNRDGIEQITQVLIDRQQNYQQFDSIQIFSHGNSGSLQLGSTNLNSSNLYSYSSELVSWSNSLKENGDILLFGCNLGAETAGLNLIDGLSQLTNADVAASDDLTGSSELGGDWDLEITTGEIEAKAAISEDTLYDYDSVLASYNGNQYFLTSEALSWVEAQAEAESLGGNLVSINDADEEAWLKANFGEDEGFWIGINDAESEGNFEWVSGESVTYTNWAPGEPNNSRNQDYGRINFGPDRLWDDEFSSTLFRGIIEVNDSNPSNSGVIGLETNNYQVNEADGTAGVTILRTKGSSGEVTVDYRTVDAAAIAGEDYTAVSGTVTFADGETSKTIIIPLINDNEVELTEDFSFTIDNVIGATLLAPRTALVSIADDDTISDGLTYNGNQYFLTSEALSWTEAQAEAESLGGNLVSINDADEEAWLKANFGEDEGFWIGINDAESEGNFEWVSGESVTYTNWAPGEPNNSRNQDYGRINFGPDRLWDDEFSSTLFRGIIEVNDSNPSNSGVIGLETNNYQVNEADGTAGVTILRTKGSSGEVTVDYRTVDAAAIAGEDYTAVSGTVTFADGETSKTIIIPLINDNEVELTEDFSFTIDNVIGATLLAPRTALVSITDDDSLTYSGNQYFLTSEALSWAEAQAEAESLGGNLVSINDGNEEAWLRANFGEDEGFWIGINDAETEGDFEWISGQPVTYTNWSPGEPNNSRNQDYGRINFGPDRLWDDAAGFAQFRGIIEIGDSNPTIGFDGTGNGLRGEYFNNIDFTDSTITRIDSTVDFDWGSGSPDPAIAPDTFSVRWTGQIESRFSETYTFRTTADDGVRLWVNDQLIINNLVEQSPTSNEGSISLVAGEKTDIRLEYYENSGNALAELSWFSDSQSLEVVPQSQLYSTLESQAILNDETVVSGLNQPTAIEWTPNGDRFFIAEKGGVIKVSQDGEVLDTPFIDLSDRVNGTRDRGLLDIAIHPDFFNGSPYVYALYTYDPPEVFQQNRGLAKPDGVGNRAGRLTRITADPATNFTTALPDSEVVILGKNSTWDNFNAFANSTNDFDEPPAGILADGTNIQDFLAADSESHSIGAVEFGPDGALYVTNGDGTSYNQVDHRSVRVQDIDNLSGKVLRIDPMTGDGLADNPFYNGDPDANRSKVYQLGLRNPFRMTIDPRNGDVYVGDVGWTQWEEINSAGPGANFGWPYYEGGNGNSLRTGGYRELPEAIDFYNSNQTVESSILALSHNQDGINAIVLGDIYTGDALPEEYWGDLFFNDLGQGIVYNVSFDADGNVAAFNTFTTGANIVVQIIEGPDGSLYYVDLDDGTIGRWFFS